MFDPEKRKIFKYHNGTKLVGIDPIEVDIALETVDIDWEAQFSLLKIGDLEAAQAIVAAARKVFQIQEYDAETDKGLTSLEVLSTLGDFVAWRTELRNFTEPLPTGERSTEQDQTVTTNGTDSI